MGLNLRETGSTPKVWHPRTAAEAWAYKRNFGPDGVYVAGGTLLRTQWEAGIVRMPANLIDLSGVGGLSDILIGEDGLLLGSQTTLQACRMHALLQRTFPMATDAVRSIAAPSVRHLATIGGNVASVVGDAVTALLAYDASLIWHTGDGERQEELTDWLLTAFQPGSLNDRLLLSVKLPFPDEQDRADSSAKRVSAYHKVGRREAFTPSLVTAAVHGFLDASGTVESIRLAVGGGQTVPRRLEEAEREMTGQTLDAKLLKHVHARIMELYEPREDVFADSAYRKRTAANVIVAELWRASRTST
ncbi:FAD binding domain-containing protein [Paenibacillus arenilitoris]|uniref:FAD binding domain-containing protein n=1 Tax=Paenibacillus arenilitoris TaxID=2772299 RepID=A0A927H918_9BACL|nr:FAD binding domain-containing protein [Paenibacillus arenilitoris]MBD2871159.1 FAD binding domain-containing protein [Paenibacillus arenilitoris]